MFMIRVLLADDHDLMRQGIRSLLESNTNFKVCGEAKNGQEAVDKAIKYRPDVAVLDVSMPEISGLEAARQIRKKLPDTQVLMFTVYDTNELVREVLDAGAHGYILKTDAPTQLIAAVEAIAQQNLYFSAGISQVVLDSLSNSGEIVENDSNYKSPLTARETEVVRLLAHGKSNKEVATALFISVRTVETHRRTIFQKLEINAIAELVRFAIRQRLIKA
jgi:DNA-binding NarL/FixJ family response regulator